MDVKKTTEYCENYDDDLLSRIANICSLIRVSGGSSDFIDIGLNRIAINSQLQNMVIEARRSQFEHMRSKTPASVLEDLIAKADGILTLAYRQAAVICEPSGKGPDPEVIYEQAELELSFHLLYLYENDPEESYVNAIAYLRNEIAGNLEEIRRRSLTAPAALPYYLSAEQPDQANPAALNQSKEGAPNLLPPHPDQLLPTVTTHALPTQFFSTTDNVSNTTFNDAEEKHAVISQKGSRYTTDVNTGRSYRTSLSIDFDAWSEDDIYLSNGKTLGMYERAVHDAVCTLYQDGHMEYITPSMIYRIMTGRDASKLSTKQIDDILNALRKLIRTFVTIKESSTHKNHDGMSMSIESSLLDGEIVEVQLYGKKATALRVKSDPILLNYASKKNQITRADLELFRIEGIKAYSQDVLLLVQSLWHRIHIMMSKSKSNMNKTILFSSLYKHLDLDGRYTGASLYNKRSWVRKNSEIILDYWKKLHFIADFEPQRDGVEYVGYTITTADGTLLESGSEE